MNALAIVIVTYFPNYDKLRNLLNSVTNDNHIVIIVDNGSGSDLMNFLHGYKPKIHFQQLNRNYGIAFAQNVGIAHARAMHAEYIAFFDQDSNPDTNFLPTLISVLTRLIAQGKQVACVGPRYIDERQFRVTPFIRIEGLSLVRPSCTNITDVIPVDHLISSGSIIPLQTFNAVGMMNEQLFIDYVDLEWCERAKSMGFQTYGVCAATMKHMLGDDPIVFFGKSYPTRSPLRHYYMCRNAIWMYRQNYVRFNWKFVDALRLLRKYFFYCLFANPRNLHFRMMTKGIWHGMTDKMGRYQD